MQIQQLKSHTKSLSESLYKQFKDYNFYAIYNIYIEHAYYKYSNSIISQYVKSENFLTEIFQYCQKVLNSTLIYEINVASNNNNLTGESENQRYKSFLHNAIQCNDSNIYIKYPVANELIVNHIHKIISNYERILERFFHDQEQLKQTYNISNLIDMTILGDPHKNGESVTKLFFKNGQVIYKPRSMEIDILFQQLLKWFNENTNLLNFKILKILDKKYYGWMEYIDQEPCSSKDEISRYFERQGYYLALFYLLNTTDMHNDNIISFNEYPVYIDLETLFHNQSFYNEKLHDANAKAQRIVSTSLFSTNILPISITNKRFENFSFSAIHKTKGKVSKFENINEFTDKIKMKRVTREILANNHHLPNYEGNYIDGEYYMYNIVCGYKKTLEKVKQNQKFLISNDSPILNFKGCNSRQVIRPTFFYGRLIDGGHHPKYLTSMKERKNFFEKLHFLDQYNLPQNILNEEILYLINDDIPIFYSQNDNTKLIINNEDISDFYQFSSFNITQNKIKELTNEQINNQIKSIVGSLDAYSEKGVLNKPNRALLESCIIANDLSSNVIKSPDYSAITWNSFKINHYGNLNYETMGIDLYSGLSGMLLFYGQLYIKTGISKYLKISYQILETIISNIKNEEYNDISLYNGLSGVIFAISQLDYILSDNKYFSFINKLLAKIKKLLHKDTQFDLIGGVSGTIIALVALYKKYRNDDIIEIAKLCSKHLFENAQTESPNYIYWHSKTYNVSQKNSFGYSHGNSGIALAILKLYEINNDKKLLSKIRKILAYETKLIDEAYNYNDLLDNNDLSWCKGILSIYLVYSEVDNYMKITKPKILNFKFEIDEKSLYLLDSCLCHGYIGIYELSQQIKNINYQSLKNYIDKKVEFHEDWWKNQIGKYNRVYGLMVGDAGVGYSLLRQFDKNTPDILMFSNI